MRRGSVTLVEVPGLFAGCGTRTCQIWASALRTGQTGPGSSRTCLQMSSKRSAVIPDAPNLEAEWRSSALSRKRGFMLICQSCSCCMMAAQTLPRLWQDCQPAVSPWTPKSTRATSGSCLEPQNGCSSKLLAPAYLRRLHTGPDMGLSLGCSPCADTCWRSGCSGKGGEEAAGSPAGRAEEAKQGPGEAEEAQQGVCQVSKQAPCPFQQSGLFPRNLEPQNNAVDTLRPHAIPQSCKDLVH